MVARTPVSSISTIRDPSTPTYSSVAWTQLPARRRARALQVAGLELRRRADVEQVEGAFLGFGLPVPSADPWKSRHPETRADPGRRRLGLFRGPSAGHVAPPAPPCSSSCPAKCQPMVPFSSAATLFGMPALTKDWAPMIERVRPAQLTTTKVSGEGARSRTR